VLKAAGEAVGRLPDQLRLVLRIWLKIRREGGRVVEEGQGASR
jgi:hypothetical protein